MNAIAALFNSSTQEDFHGFVTRTESTMPGQFIASALRRNDLTFTDRRQLEESKEIIEAQNYRSQFWQNPEIYIPLTRLMTSSRDSIHVSEDIHALRLHLGISRPLDEVAHLRHPFYRLVHSHGIVYENNHGLLREIKIEEVSFTCDRTLVFLPRRGFFNDIVETALYPEHDSHIDSRDLTMRTLESFQLLSQYSRALKEDFDKTIRYLVLTPDFGDLERWSYNLRLSYYGAIFLNPFRVNTYGLVESLIHEYCHQRFWLWWTFGDVRGIPPLDSLIASPITGRMKPTVVMAQALFIYLYVLDFYTWLGVNASHLSPEYQTWVADRKRKLHHGIPLLYDRLDETLTRGTNFRSIVDEMRSTFS